MLLISVIAFEFNFALTTLSFLLILIQYQMAIAVAENLPSPHQFKFVFDFINRFLFWIPKFEYGGTKVQHSTEVSETAENAMTKNFTHDWLAINEAVHRLLFIFFLFTYLIGTIILVSF